MYKGSCLITRERDYRAVGQISNPVDSGVTINLHEVRFAAVEAERVIVVVSRSVSSPITAGSSGKLATSEADHKAVLTKGALDIDSAICCDGTKILESVAAYGQHVVVIDSDDGATVAPGENLTVTCRDQNRGLLVTFVWSES